MAGRLFVVGTPIGNLSDFSPRAVETLEKVDFIAAEDTRVTVKLLNHFGIKKELVSYYEHNKSQRGDEIIARIEAGESCALVSDAGMPAISDPGEELVRSALDNGITVESVPGPAACVTALSISGMKSGRFCFEGFLSVNRQERREHLSSLVREERTMIFYEAPHKLIHTLADMKEAFGERNIAVIKELTKIHETVMRTTFSDAISFFENMPPKGEYVIIVEGAQRCEETQEYTLSQAVEIARKLMKNGNSASTAAKEAARLSGFRKGEIYSELMLG